jgi:UDP-N-acetylglucosamine 2-epimerase (non-hydrolysing)
MTEFDEPDEDSLDDDYDHDILLVAGSRPEVARLAPVARAFESVGRIRAITIATGCDPMSVHEAFEALGVPVDVTVLLHEPLGPNPADVAAVLLTRLDGLLVDLDPSAIMVHGGGMTAVVAAQVAFWRQIPVVHLQAGVATDDLLCPFPQEANRRVIGQLA